MSSPSEARFAKPRTLNVRFFVVSVVLLLVLCAAAYFWHQRQLRSIAQAMLQRAEALEGNQEFSQAAGYLHRYLQLYPDSRDVRIRLARTFDQSAATFSQKMRASELYYRAVGYAPDDIELRERLAILLMELNRVASALEQAEAILDVDPRNSTGLRVRAAALYAQARLGKPISMDGPIQDLLQILKEDPGNQQAAMLVAEIYRNYLRRPDEPARQLMADSVMNRMVEATPQDLQARLLRHAYRLTYELAGADADLAAALRIAPDHPEVLLRSAEAALRRSEPKQAVTFATQLIEQQPQIPSGYIRLGEGYVALGQFDDAIETWRRGLRITDAQHPALNLLLADALIVQNRLNEADEALGVLERLPVAPDIPTTLAEEQQVVMRPMVDLLRGRYYVAARQPWKAIDVLKRTTVTSQALAEADRSRVILFECLVLLGRIYAEQQQWDLAAQAYEDAASLPVAESETSLIAARYWMAAGRLDDALRTCLNHINRPEAPREFHQVLLEVRLQQYRQQADDDRLQSLLSALTGAEAAMPDSWPVVMLKAQVQGLIGRTDEALATLRAAEAEFASDPHFWQQLAIVYQQTGQQADADRALSQLAGFPEQPEMHVSRLQAELLAELGQPQKAQQILMDRATGAAAQEKAAALSALADLAWGRDELEAARKLYIQALEADRTLETLQRLVELAFDRNDLNDGEHWEEQLRELEGENGTWWRLYRANRLVRAASTVADPRFAEASQIQRDLELLRPSWAPAKILRGLIADKSGKLTEAMSAYEQAVLLGSQERSVFERLLVLFYKHEEYGKADRLLRAFLPYPSLDRIPRLTFVAPYVEYLLQQDRVQDAQPWLELAASEAEEDFVWLALRMQALKATGDGEHVEPQVEAFMTRQLAASLEAEAEEQLMLQAGQLYATLDRPEAAGRWFRTLQQKHPNQYAPLAIWLAGRGETREAAQIVTAVLEQELTVNAGITLAEVIVAAPDLPEEIAAETQQWLEQLTQKHTDDPGLLFAVGSVYLKLHRPDHAARLLRRVTELQPQHAAAWNNLAAALVEQDGNIAEAEQAIEKAIGLAGSLPTLLDTKATVLLVRGEPEEAIKLLETVTSSGDEADPRYWLHLAMAYHEIQDMESARIALEQAEDRDIEQHYLTGREARSLASLRQRLLLVSS